MTSVLLLEPYCTGSHRAWAQGYRAASGLDVANLTMPGRFWKWRMHGAALTLARLVGQSGVAPDVILATDMLDVAAFRGLARGRASEAPLALYMHENQLAYPAPSAEAHWSASRRRRAARRDAHYPYVNVTSMLAADAVFWNSRHNRDSFLDRLPAFLRSFPDFRETWAVDAIAAKSRVLPVGLDLASLSASRPAVPRGRHRRVLWNHRWEHDKGPGLFFSALRALDDRGVEYEVVVLGESFVRAPAVFEEARRALGPRCLHFGYVEDRAAYAGWLHACDVVVSTARHDFFGTAVLEAVSCGCLPLLPRGLAYPELMPSDSHENVLYDDFEDLVDRLEAALRDPDSRLSRRLAAEVTRYDWGVMATDYDRELLGLAGRGRDLDGP